MNIIKSFIYTWGIPSLGRIFVSRNKYCNVIYYHDIVEDKGLSYQKTNIEVFKKQMKYLQSNGYTTLRFDDLDTDEDISYHPKKIIIAFDDGWKSNYSIIYDFMKENNIKYNIFLTMKEIDNNPEYLSWEQIKMMHNEGYVGFGVHTFSHPHIDAIENIKPALEFHQADIIFEEHLGYKPIDFCYPFGTYTEETNKYLIENTNYRRIYTSNLMYSYLQDERLIFGRNGIKNEESMEIFKDKVKGYFNVWNLIIK